MGGKSRASDAGWQTVAYRRGRRETRCGTGGGCRSAPLAEPNSRNDGNISAHNREINKKSLKRSYASVTRGTQGDVQNSTRVPNTHSHTPREKKEKDIGLSDPHFGRKTRILFKIIKAVHHLKNATASQVPPSIRKTTSKLNSIIKPAGPTERTHQLILENAIKWQQNTMSMLTTHYTDMIETHMQMLMDCRDLDIETPFIVASTWARRNLGKRLLDETLEEARNRVNTLRRDKTGPLRPVAAPSVPVHPPPLLSPQNREPSPSPSPPPPPPPQRDRNAPLPPVRGTKTQKVKVVKVRVPGRAKYRPPGDLTSATLPDKTHLTPKLGPNTVWIEGQDKWGSSPQILTDPQSGDCNVHTLSQTPLQTLEETANAVPDLPVAHVSLIDLDDLPDLQLEMSPLAAIELPWYPEGHERYLPLEPEVGNLGQNTETGVKCKNPNTGSCTPNTPKHIRHKCSILRSRYRKQKHH